MAKEKVRKDLLDRAVEIVENLEVAEEDFKSPEKGEKPPIHDRIIWTLVKELERQPSFVASP